MERDPPLDGSVGERSMGRSIEIRTENGSDKLQPYPHPHLN